jgi:hypothetical protein
MGMHAQNDHFCMRSDIAGLAPSSRHGCFMPDSHVRSTPVSLIVAVHNEVDIVIAGTGSPRYSAVAGYAFTRPDEEVRKVTLINSQLAIMVAGVVQQ